LQQDNQIACVVTPARAQVYIFPSVHAPNRIPRGEALNANFGEQLKGRNRIFIGKKYTEGVPQWLDLRKQNAQRFLQQSPGFFQPRNPGLGQLQAPRQTFAIRLCVLFDLAFKNPVPLGRGLCFRQILDLHFHFADAGRKIRHRAG